MLNQTHLRGCGHCRRTTTFMPVRIGDAAGVMCLSCGKRWVAHFCSHDAPVAEPELLPLLVDFGVNAAYDAFCPGCRRGISVLNSAARAVRPYDAHLAESLSGAAQVLAVVATAVTAVGAARWLARQLR
jgi:hypothetical protein